jgi:8-oxo-dGTP diphosphatase
VVVTAAVVRRGGRILLARRGPGQRHAGEWEFPGGKVEAGETDAECLRRELREEFGLGSAVGERLGIFRHAYSHANVELRVYAVRLSRGAIRRTVHDRVAWARPGELATYSLAAADRPVAEHLARSVCRRLGKGTT